MACERLLFHPWHNSRDFVGDQPPGPDAQTRIYCGPWRGRSGFVQAATARAIIGWLLWPACTVGTLLYEDSELQQSLQSQPGYAAPDEADLAPRPNLADSR
jgi:hypothetical protein